MPRNFEFPVIVCPTPNTITLGVGTFMALTDFQFKFLPIDIIDHTRISPLEKQRQNALHLALISFSWLNRLCPKSAPEHIIIVQSSPGIYYFYSLFVGNIVSDF